MRLPNFIIGGAPRSGTTWLTMVLEKHPEIYIAKPLRPEPKFFLIDELWKKGIKYYSETWFSSAPIEAKCGEKSTNYLENPEVARRIHSILPDVRLIFILRNPALRAFSNYCWSKMNGLENLSFKEAIEQESLREQNLPEKYKFSRPYSYYSRGVYIDMLKPYLELFPSSHICTLQFEDVIRDSLKVIEKVHDFIGVTIKPEDALLIPPANSSEKYMDEYDRATLLKLQEMYRKPNELLSTALEMDFERWSDPNLI